MINEEAVHELIRKYRLSCGAQVRYMDLVSEVGELGKELIRGVDYGKRALRVTAETEEEMGDCLFSLLALCGELDIRPEEALKVALDKYERRFAQKGSVDSGR